MRATGTFGITMSRQPPYDSDGGVALGRMAGDKEFRGGLEGKSHVEMLSAGGTVKGSAGYVAIERVVGTLDGKTGSFVLQHSGTMTRGTPTLTVSVVPDTGTGALVGIAGRMTIDIVDGEHEYAFEYTID